MDNTKNSIKYSVIPYVDFYERSDCNTLYTLYALIISQFNHKNFLLSVTDY